MCPLEPDLGATMGRAFGRAHLGCVNRPKVSSATGGGLPRRAPGGPGSQCVDTAVEDYSLSC